MKTSRLLLLSAALFTSCSFVPELGKPGVEVVPVSFPGNGSGTTSATLDWNSFFKDPRLKKLVSIALDNNRDLRIAALNVEQARGQYGISRSSLFPTVDLSATGSRQRTPGSTVSGGTAVESRNYDVSVGVTAYELDLFGRVRSLNDAALQSYFASDAARLGAQITLVSEIAARYLTERALLEEIELSEQTLASVSKTYELTRQRLEAGDVSELDSRSVEIQVKTAEANLAAYRQQLAETHNALAFLIGSSLPSDLPAGRGLDQTLVAELRAGVPSDLLSRRPDILEAEHQLRAANANIGAARAAFFPRVTLTGGAGTASKSLGDLFQSGSSAWAFSPQISVPIFDGGYNKANLEVAEVRKQIGVAQYEKAIQNAFREVSDGLAARSGLNGQIEAYEGLVAAQQKRFDLADTRYQQGVDSYFEVLDAHQDLYAARQGLIRLRLARLTNAVGLYKALGGGW
ncbi:efflux transporter outer membrane subunit [Luteolibacter flavescens]|uniref:Efflux transporter outer membrane subunit n=1 Tax=Luteolibacter flavescens TaxID=1859460 RepID=A0ABT3FV20_9BACT|nr:efflux transporter outer membrane subunit [Luteolibacter flavescens]MCW1887059.1 efflux transporter outer membrane subunit [Luteolibacter flavescens]